MHARISYRGSLLGLDVGDKRVGVAVAEIGGISVPVGTFLREKGRAEKEILKLIKERNVSIVVAGLPLDEKGRENKQCLKIKDFCRRLARRADIRVEFVDEYLTSYEARDLMGRKQLRKGSKIEDTLSAALILGSYLERGR